MLGAAKAIYFWSGIMRDHGEFQLRALSSREHEAVMASQYYKDSFTNLGNEAAAFMDAPLSQPIINLINKACCPALSKNINYLF